jgi:predicted dinucleotide-binding enzyme
LVDDKQILSADPAFSTLAETLGTQMKIAIIGIGNVGKALAANWSSKGHEVCFGAAAPGSEKINDVLVAIPGSRACTVREAANDAEVIVLAVPFDAVKSVLEECGDLAGKIILDCTNPLAADFRELAMGFSTSGGELVASLAPRQRLQNTQPNRLRQHGQSHIPRRALRDVRCGRRRCKETDRSEID